MAGKYKIATIILGLIVLAVAIVLIVAGCKAGADGISFGEALGQLFGAVAETAGEVVEEGGEVAEDVVETVASII